MSELGDRVVKGAFWLALEKFAAKGLSFLVTIALARILTPSDYGIVALLMIFVEIAGFLVESGMGAALVQKKDAKDIDFNSAFIISISIAAILYLLLFFTAPSIAAFYKLPSLVSILRVMSLIIVFNTVNSIVRARITRELRFEFSFRITLVGEIIAAAVGLFLAINGFGPWAIVWKSLCYSVVSGIVGIWLVGWIPNFSFSFSSACKLLTFGWQITVASILAVVYRNVFGLIIGRCYSKEDLAYVDKGSSLPNLAMEVVCAMVGNTSLSAIAKLRDDTERAREAVFRMMRCATFISFPLMVGMAICAPDVIELFFGRQWMFSVPYLRLTCFAMALHPIMAINGQVMLAYGRSDLYLKVSLLSTFTGVLLIMLVFRQGVWAIMAMSSLVVYSLQLLFGFWIVRYALKYSIIQLVRCFLPVIWACGVFAFVGWRMVTILSSAGGFGGIVVRIAATFIVGGVLFGLVVRILNAPVLRDLSSLVSRLVPEHQRTLRWILELLLGVKIINQEGVVDGE